MLPVSSGRVHMENGRRARVGAFQLDTNPVTNAEYGAYMTATGTPKPQWMHKPGFGDPEHPVVGLTLAEATAYARWAGKRLPTEAEWVRAARGDDDRPYPWGDVPPDYALAHFRKGPKGAPAHVTTRERPDGAGPFGHTDLAGNVWEWCRSGALRGGFWGSPDVRIDERLVDRPDRISGGYGLRCAR